MIEIGSALPLWKDAAPELNDKTTQSGGSSPSSHLVAVLKRGIIRYRALWWRLLTVHQETLLHCHAAYVDNADAASSLRQFVAYQAVSAPDKATTGLLPTCSRLCSSEEVVRHHF